MVLLIANNKATTGSTTVSTTIEIDLSISVSTLTVKSNGSCSSSSGVSSKSSSESTCGDSCSNDGNSLDSTPLISSSSSSSSSSSTTSTPVKKSERLLAKSGSKGSGCYSLKTPSESTSSKADSVSLPEEGICMWRECSCVGESASNMLDHIQVKPRLN